MIFGFNIVGRYLVTHRGVSFLKSHCHLQNLRVLKRKMIGPDARFFLRKRYLVAVLAFLGMACLNVLRTNLSIALVRMTLDQRVVVGNETITQVSSFTWIENHGSFNRIPHSFNQVFWSSGLQKLNYTHQSCVDNRSIYRIIFFFQLVAKLSFCLSKSSGVFFGIEWKNCGNFPREGLNLDTDKKWIFLMKNFARWENLWFFFFFFDRMKRPGKWPELQHRLRRVALR